MESAAETGAGIVLSSHVIGDLERICDYLVVLAASRVRLAGEIEQLLESHRQLVGPRRYYATPQGAEVISARHSERQTTFLVRTQRPVEDPAWTVARIGLEDLVLEYMKDPMEAAR